MARTGYIDFVTYSVLRAFVFSCLCSDPFSLDWSFS